MRPHPDKDIMQLVLKIKKGVKAEEMAQRLRVLTAHEEDPISWVPSTHTHNTKLPIFSVRGSVAFFGLCSYLNSYVHDSPSPQKHVIKKNKIKS